MTGTSSTIIQRLAVSGFLHTSLPFPISMSVRQYSQELGVPSYVEFRVKSENFWSFGFQRLPCCVDLLYTPLPLLCHTLSTNVYFRFNSSHSMLLFSKLLSANLAIHKVSQFQILDEDKGLLAGSEALLH